jgi:hypothetical protein
MVDINGLIVEDGYVIVGRAGQRVMRPGELAQVGADSRSGARRPERESGAVTPLAEGHARLTDARGASGVWLSQGDLSGPGSTRPGI